MEQSQDEFCSQQSKKKIKISFTPLQIRTKAKII